MPLVSFTRATLRSAEFGFFGVVVYTRVHTPRRCGLPFRAAVFCLATLSWRPLRTSCWIVGIDRLSSRVRCVWPCASAVPVTRGRACRPTSGSRVGLNQPRRGSGGTAEVPAQAQRPTRHGSGTSSKDTWRRHPGSKRGQLSHSTFTRRRPVRRLTVARYSQTPQAPQHSTLRR